MTAQRALILLILIGTLIRVLFGWGLGLGIDESYMVVAGRGAFRLGYFDHPLVSWWMSHGIAHLAGSEASLVVRSPFIALFALSTWLMFLLGRDVDGERAGLWAAISFNLAPVMGVTSGGWVLPDGPLVAALLGCALCLMRALPGRGWGWWLGAGACAGLALLSKYTAVLTIGGLGLFLLTQRAHRGWLLRPQPYAALLVAALVFSPVIVWNAQNGWASLAFQGGRAQAARLNLLGPVVTLAGEALFLLPWIWAGLMLVLWRGLRGADWRGRLLCWMALPAIVLFAVVSLWSRQVLFHWATPGYLMLFPLLGAWLADKAWAPRVACWTAALVAGMMVLAVSEARLAWAPVPAEATLALREWTALRPALVGTGLPIAVTSWSEAGKAGIGLGADIPLFCLNPDAREFRFSTHPPTSGDVIIIAPHRSLAQMRVSYGGAFREIEALPPVRVGGADIPIYRGRGVLSWPY